MRWVVHRGLACWLVTIVLKQPVLVLLVVEYVHWSIELNNVVEVEQVPLEGIVFHDLRLIFPISFRQSLRCDVAYFACFAAAAS